MLTFWVAPTDLSTCAGWGSFCAVAWTAPAVWRRKRNVAGIHAQACEVQTAAGGERQQHWIWYALSIFSLI